MSNGLGDRGWGRIRRWAEKNREKIAEAKSIEDCEVHARVVHPALTPLEAVHLRGSLSFMRIWNETHPDGGDHE